MINKKYDMKVDLALTKIFIGIYETLNLTHAAQRLHLSQPSISYNLNRLRDQLNDDLFVRTRHGVSPTKIADQLYPTLKKAMLDIEMAFAQVSDFDPQTACKTFRIGLSDIGEICLLPIIMNYFLKHAPHIKIIVEEVSISNIEHLLEQDKIDVAIFNSTYTQLKKVQKAELFTLHYVCLANRSHPRIKDQLNLEQYQAEKHIAIKSSTGHLQVNQFLNQLDITHNIALEVPHFSVLGELIKSTDLLVTLPIDAAKTYMKDPEIKMYELPFKSPEFCVSLHWFDHCNDIKARHWLIATLRSLLSKY